MDYEDLKATIAKIDKMIEECNINNLNLFIRERGDSAIINLATVTIEVDVSSEHNKAAIYFTGGVL